MDQSSSSRFSMGVPVRASLKEALSLRTALAWNEAGVLDGLGLVHHRHAPVARAEDLLLPADHAVGGEHDGVGPELPGQAVPVVAVVHEEREARGEPGDLPLPVAQQGGGADEQGGRAHRGAWLLAVQQQGQHLDGLVAKHAFGHEIVVFINFQVIDPAGVVTSEMDLILQ